MALMSFKRVRDKQKRISDYWGGVSDEVFTKLRVERAKLQALELGFQGHIELPGMPGYDQDRQGNPLFPAFPQIIAYCANSNDVRLSLEWAREYGWIPTCRSGGHSTAGFSVNNGLVIDLSLMNHVSINSEKRQMHVGSGANWGSVNSVLNLYQLHVPGGGCPDVGVGGFMMGGGYGFTSREFGMNSDNVLEFTMMLPDGKVVTANRNHHELLFWAVRGGTGNQFGVLLEVKYRLYDLYQVWGFGIQWPLSTAAEALLEMQQNYMLTGAPPELGYQSILCNVEGKPSLVMLGMFHGDPSKGRKALGSLLAISGANLFIDKIDTYAHLNDSLLAGLNQPTAALIEFKRSGYISAPQSLSEWQEIVKYFGTSPNIYNIVGIEAYGGAIKTYPVRQSAFIHRDDYCDLFVDSFFDKDGKITDRDTAQKWIDSYMKILTPHFNGHVYQNYPVRDFPNFRWAYWGDAFDCLMKAKQKYDPGNLLRFEQSISPYPPGPEINRSKIKCRRS